MAAQQQAACVTCSTRSLLWALNASVMAVGVLVTGAAGYVLQEFHNTEGLHLVQREGVLALALVGLGLLSAALFGCVGSTRELSCALRTYFVSLLVLVILQGVMTASFVSYAGRVKEDQLSGDMIDAIGCAFDLCCRNATSTSTCSLSAASACDDLPTIFAQACDDSSKSAYLGEIAAWAQDKLRPASVTLGVCCIAEACCVAAVLVAWAAQLVLGRRVVSVVSPGPEDSISIVASNTDGGDTAYARLAGAEAERERRHYHRLRSFFRHKLPRQEAATP